MHVHVYQQESIRTTVEISNEQRAHLLKLVPERAGKGFSRLLQEALELYLRENHARRKRVAAARATLGFFTENEVKPLHQSVRGRIDAELSSGHLADTVVIAFELLSGTRTTVQQTRIERLLGAMTLFPLEFSAADIASRIRPDLESKGDGIGMTDYLITGICLSRNVMLLTSNRDHFQHIPGLYLADLSGDS